MEINKVYELINKLNIFYDMIGVTIKVDDVINEEELKLLIDYINSKENLEQQNIKKLYR